MTHPCNVETKEAAGEERERPKISETNAPANGVSKVTQCHSITMMVRQVITHTRDATAHRVNYLDKG